MFFIIVSHIAEKEKTFLQLVEKVCFFKKVLVLNPYPQTPFPRKGAECGAAALTPLGATPQTPLNNNRDYHFVVWTNALSKVKQ